MIDDTPGDAAISAMVDIARMSGLDLNREQRSELDRLVTCGWIEKIAAAGESGPARYAVTFKGQKMLDNRGVGVNES